MFYFFYYYSSNINLKKFLILRIALLNNGNDYVTLFSNYSLTISIFLYYNPIANNNAAYVLLILIALPHF